MRCFYIPYLLSLGKSRITVKPESNFLLQILVEREQRTLATATFVHQVDELFGTFNGRQLNTGYEFQGVELRNFARVNALVVLGKSISGRENMAVPKAYQNG